MSGRQHGSGGRRRRAHPQFQDGRRMHGQGSRDGRKTRSAGVLLRNDCRRCRKTQAGRSEREGDAAMRRTESWLGGSAARRLGGSAARRLGGSAHIVPATPDANVKRRDDPSPVSPAPAATPATPPFADTLRPAGGPLPFIVVVIAPLRFSSPDDPPNMHAPRQIFAHSTFENGNACTVPTEAPCSRRSPPVDGDCPRRPGGNSRPASQSSLSRGSGVPMIRP